MSLKEDFQRAIAQSQHGKETGGGIKRLSPQEKALVDLIKDVKTIAPNDIPVRDIFWGKPDPDSRDGFFEMTFAVLKAGFTPVTASRWIQPTIEAISDMVKANYKIDSEELIKILTKTLNSKQALRYPLKHLPIIVGREAKGNLLFRQDLGGKMVEFWPYYRISMRIERGKDGFRGDNKTIQIFTSGDIRNIESLNPILKRYQDLAGLCTSKVQHWYNHSDFIAFTLTAHLDDITSMNYF